MTEKLFIQKGELNGNLRDYSQSYHINYIPKTEELDHKTEIVIGIIDANKDYIEEYRSIRFNNSSQLKSFILGLLRSYFIMCKKEKIITPENHDFKVRLFFKELLNIFREVFS